MHICFVNTFCSYTIFNEQVLYSRKKYVYIYIYIYKYMRNIIKHNDELFVCVGSVLFYGISTFVGYLSIFTWTLTDKMKRSFFQAAVTSILLYGCTTWTLTKRLEKKLDCNYTRMLRAILNKSWQQHPTRHQLYGHLPPMTKTIQVRLN